LGGVRVKGGDTNISIDPEDGTISAKDTTYEAATEEEAGIVKPDGTTITVNDGVISAVIPVVDPYELPIASREDLGGVRVKGGDTNISIDPEDGTISVPKATENIYGVVQYSVYNATIQADKWENDSNGSYTQTIEILGILESDVPVIDIIPTDTPGIAREELQVWGKIGRITTANDAIKVTCYDYKPKLNLAIQIKLIRS